MGTGDVLVNGATGALGRATMAAIGARAVAGTRRPVSAFARSIRVPDDGRVDPDLLRGIDAIVNCAGRVDGTEAELTATNVDHVRHLAAAAAAAGVRRFVQVSSFSVYGPAETIGPDTAIAPATSYGRSKAAAERVLDTVGGTMSTISLRLPFMFDRGKPALLGQLVALFRRIPAFPVAPYPVRRSMLTYPDAAAVLAIQTAATDTGRLAVADPEPFTNAMLVALLRDHGFRAPALVRVPAPVAALLRRHLPRIGQRLFASSELRPDHNAARDIPLPRGIVAEIGALLDALRDAGEQR